MVLAMLLLMQDLKEVPQNPEVNPVVATVDVIRVNTNIDNAVNKDGVFQSYYTSTLFNLYLLQSKVQSPLRTLTGFYYVNVQVGFETLPQTGGTIAEPPSPTAGFDSSGIKTASRTSGTLTFGWSFDTNRINRSIKAAGPFLDYRLFDYIKDDNVGKRDRSGSFRVGYHYVIPLDSNNRNIIQLELSAGRDRFYATNPSRVIGKARYDLYPVIDGNSVFFEFSYNRNMNGGVGPVELRYAAGVRFDAQRLISGLTGAK